MAAIRMGLGFLLGEKDKGTKENSVLKLQNVHPILIFMWCGTFDVWIGQNIVQSFDDYA